MIVEELEFKHNLKSIMRQNRLNYGNEYNKNILFLDFDGVINIPLKNYEKYSEEQIMQFYHFGDKSCVNNLNTLCIMYDFKIVISSSWRISGLEYCTDYLLKSGLDARIEIIGMTKNEGYVKRYYEIYDYLIKNPDFTNFIIIDDLPMGFLSHYAIKTEFEDGFNEKKLQKAIKLCDEKFK